MSCLGFLHQCYQTSSCGPILLWATYKFDRPVCDQNNVRCHFPRYFRIMPKLLRIMSKISTNMARTCLFHKIRRARLIREYKRSTRIINLPCSVYTKICPSIVGHVLDVYKRSCIRLAELHFRIIVIIPK